MSEEQDMKIVELSKEIRGLQEMLYQVLTEIGEPVLVPLETLKQGVQGNKQISVVQDSDYFIFSITEVPVEDQPADA